MRQFFLGRRGKKRVTALKPHIEMPRRILSHLIRNKYKITEAAVTRAAGDPSRASLRPALS